MAELVAAVPGHRRDRGGRGRRCGQPGADRAGLRPRVVHRRHRDRPQGLRGRGAAPDAGHAGTRRQEPGDRRGGRRPRRRGQADRVDQADELRPDLRRARLRAGRCEDPRRTRRARSATRSRQFEADSAAQCGASASSTSASSTGWPATWPPPRARSSIGGGSDASRSADPADRGRRPRSGRAADEGGDLRADPAGADGPIPRRRNQIRQLAAQAAGGLPVHQGQEHPRTGDQGGARGRHARQPPGVPGDDRQAAVRRRRPVRDGRLPRQVGLRGVQPPQDRC